MARTPQKLAELPTANVVRWTGDEIPDLQLIAGCDAVVHLAGKGIADQRWTKTRKQKIWDSRVIGTKNLVSAFAKIPASERPKVFISSSAIGIYGSSPDTKTEESKKGTGFLADLCQEWEASALDAEKCGIRTVILRTGLVLSNRGGILKKSAPVALGQGHQWMSWVHIQDVINFIVFAFSHSPVRGPYNVTAPNPVTNIEFTKMYAQQTGLPFLGHAPHTVLKAVLGEMAEAILANQKAVPEKIAQSNFRFRFETLDSALSDLIGGRTILDNQFLARQFVPLPKENIFPFFANAENLEVLTPPWLNFHIHRKSTPDIEKGTLIEYKLKIHGVPVRWKTLISDWTPQSRFIDEQLKGPYKKWHHTHLFESVKDGTLISDEVIYRPPGLILGKLLLPLITKDISEIFKYRQQKIRELFHAGKIT